MSTNVSLCPQPDDYLLTTKELATLLRVHTSTVERWRSQGTGPTFTKGSGMRGRVLYLLSDVRAWIEANKRRSTSDRGGE